MAKKNRRKQKSKTQSEFFETLSVAASALNLPSAKPKQVDVWEDQIIGLAKEIGPVTWATLKDLGKLFRALAKRVFSRTAWKIYLVVAALGLIAAVVSVTIIASQTYSNFASDLASPAALANKHKTGTTILDRNGKVLYQVYGATNRDPVTFDATPKDLVNATLAAEDAGFFNHQGIDPRGLARAVYEDIINHNTVQGGSTLTQQLVKNTLLSSNHDIMRKVQEMALAIELERRYSKQQIMEMYLNDIYYGEGSYGVGTAAHTYFNTDISHLSLGQDALLAGLPLGPSRFDPAVYPDAARARRDFVLDRMQELSFITPEQAAAAKAEPITASAQQITIKAPWFVFYVLDQLRAKYGDDLVEHGGITVTTTLDLDKQELAQNLVRAQIEKLRGRNVTNAALIAVTPQQGEIISMVGSYDYNDPNYGSVNVTTSERQPGSSMKPICYMAGFEHGMNGATALDDKPLNIPDGTGQVYSPKDYDLKWRGTVTLRRAIAGSLNVPAVNMLKQIGVGSCLDMAHRLGITTLSDPSRYGLSLTLGAGEVKMIDMAGVYSTIDNLGIKVTPKAILKVADRNGADITLPAPKIDPQPVIDPRYAYMMTDILTDNNAKTEIFGVNTPFKIPPYKMAVKTGTTTDFRDNWTVAYTPDIVTVVWAGNNDNSPMGQVDGFTGAAPIMHDYMAAYLAGTTPHDWTQPAGLIRQGVCYMGDGGLANPWDGSVIQELFLAEAPQKRHCASQAPPPPPAPAPVAAPVETPEPNSPNNDQSNQTPNPKPTKKLFP